MCLDAHAHGMRVNHDIFNTPNKVQLTIEEQPTPKSYANYPEGRTLGKAMPMWRVQTEGYLTHPAQPVGIVSRDKGFLDSPDTEWISGGVNSKGPNAVALGRHGNFFHWGFAASPTYMTDEAKNVLVNAVHYIARFAGQTPIARKKRGTLTRHFVDAAIESMTDAAYARKTAVYAGFAKDQKKRQAAIQKRIDAGEEVSRRDRQMLRMKPARTPDRLSYAKRLLTPEIATQLNGDRERISTYLRENRPYFRPEGWATLRVDEQLKSIGIPSDNIALLDRLVVTLLAGDKDGVAKTLLERYTDQSFATAQEWAQWLDARRSRLFFTEAGGFKWLVNTIGKAKPKAQKLPETGKSTVPAPSAIKATAEQPLASGLSVKALGKGRFMLTVHIDVFAGWHAYATVPENSAYQPLRLALELPKGAHALGEWKKPAANVSIEEPELTMWEGRLSFKREIECAQAGVVTCKINGQVCDAEQCMPPTVTKHTIALGR